MFYSVKSGDSPATIARRFGVSRQALINANPHKPRTTVAGQQTWQGIRHGETVRVPVGTAGVGAVTPALPGASHQLIKKGSSGPDVALWQTIIGVTPDGVFGSGTDTATRAWQGAHGVSADGVVGPNTWAAAIGGAFPAAAAAAAPAASSSLSLAATAAAAAAALAMDANYCTSVAKSGTAVNTAVHNFKAAWNSANPGQAVPINTGKYEPVVASALSSALGGIPVPPGCGGAAAPAIPPVALPPIALPQMPSLPSAIPVSLPTSSSAPTAVQAMASIDPCYSGNAAMVCAAQAALGLHPDGKYGPGTAAALQRFIPNAPAGCSGPPLWWGKTTDNKCGGALPTMPSLPSLPAALPQISTSLPGLPSLPTAPSTPWSDSPTATVPAATAPIPSSPAQASTAAPGGPTQPVVVAPADKGISTGAMVAGGLGLAALVGVVAVAAGGKKSTTRSTTITRPARRKPSKPAHHKKK